MLVQGLGHSSGLHSPSKWGGEHLWRLVRKVRDGLLPIPSSDEDFGGFEPAWGRDCWFVF